MTPFWKRDADRALDAQLRAARPRPRAEVTTAIVDRVADRVPARDSAGKRHLGRLQLALAGGLTALVLTPVVATGFGGLGTIGKSSKAKSDARAAFIKKGTGRALWVARPKAKRAVASRKSASGSHAAFAPGDGLSGFIGSIFEPKNDLGASIAQYKTCQGAIIQTNTGKITQGDNVATGGNATSTGGNGGNASTGNTQSTNGTTRGTGGISFGGSTSATSGNATGGAGGSATSTGGNATAGNVADQTLVNSAC